MKKEIIVQKDAKSPIAEVFRTLRTNIQFMNPRKRIKTILVTSILPGEGKSWVTANLAVTCAQTGKKVLIVDSDLRKGRQHVMLGVKNDKGLSEYLANEKKETIANYIKETEVDNLFVIPTGKIPPNPSELLLSEHCLEMIDNLKQVFDIIIFDGTPTALVTDSMILSGMVDTTLIVAQYNKTKKDDLIKLKKEITNIGGKIAGVVINRQSINIKKYEKKYYYSGTKQLVKVKNN